MFVTDYNICLKEKLIIERYEGFVNLEQLKAFKLIQFQDELYSSSYNVILDVRECFIDGATFELEKVIKFILEYKFISNNCKTAVLTNTPRQVVFFTLLASQYIAFEQQMKVFSTREAANKWLY